MPLGQIICRQAPPPPVIYRVKQIEAFKCITLNDYAVIIGVVPRMSDMGHLHIGFIYLFISKR